MATITQVFAPESARVFNTAIPELIQVIGTGTSPFSFLAYAFDVTTPEQIFFITRLANYGASNPTLTLDVDWYSVTSATSGTCIWGWSMAAYTATTDNVIFSAKSLATTQTASTTAVATGGRLFRTTVPNTANKDSAAADDVVVIRLFRDAATDTMLGDAAVVLVTLTYSDT